MNKGQRIAEKLRDLDEEDKAITQWLVFYVIYKNPGITLAKLQIEIENLWRKINKKHSKFFLNFGGCSDGHNYNTLDLEDALVNYAEIGLIRICCCKICKDKDGAFYLNNYGARLLLDGLIYANMYDKFKEVIQ
jgi:hypothetical protein